MVHASEFLLAKGTFPATLDVGLRQSHVSPARSGARDATTGTKRWRRELWCFFLHAGASDVNVWLQPNIHKRGEVGTRTESANGKVTCIS